MVLIGGAGMAGLVAAARLRELGVEATLLEKGNRPGGSMLLSSGVVWRHRSLGDFRAECPSGDPVLQALIVDRLDDGLAWLESVGAAPVRRETGNPRTIGTRFDPRQLTEALVRRAGVIRLETPLAADTADDDTVILATGGFAATLARRLELPLRGAPWSEGDGLFFAERRGAGLSNGMDEFYGRMIPAPPAVVPPEEFVRASQVYGRFAAVFDEGGRRFETADVAWHEADLVQEVARLPGGRAWFCVDEETLARPLGAATVADRVDAARRLGGTVVEPASLGFDVAASVRVAVHVTASVTHTIGGLRVDEQARVLDDDGQPIESLFAAGVDAGGVATGGYASGLATALVLALAAAEAAAG